MTYRGFYVKYVVESKITFFFVSFYFYFYRKADRFRSKKNKEKAHSVLAILIVGCINSNQLRFPMKPYLDI